MPNDHSSDPEHNRPKREESPPAAREATPRPADAPDQLDRLSVLAHELRSLLDGCLRRLALAQRGLHEDDDEPDVCGVRRQLDHTRTALEQMASLVGLSMRGSSIPLGSALTTEGITLAETIAHAADVLAPRADEHRVRMDLRIDEEAGAVPAGPLYVVVLNALANAIDSCALAGGSRRVDVRAQRRDDRILIEITDEGIGLIAGVEPEDLFRLGITTKPAGHGIGLAVCRELVGSVNGSIEIANRPDGARGALLRIAVPIASASASDQAGAPDADPDTP